MEKNKYLRYIHEKERPLLPLQLCNFRVEDNAGQQELLHELTS